jgi:hypothetical protein
MNRQEVAQLLTMAALIDNRTITPEAIIMWHGVLGHVDYQPALVAVQDHFRETTAWLMPAHIIQRVRDARRKGLPDTMSPAAPESCEPGAHRWLPDGTCLFCITRQPELAEA